MNKVVCDKCNKEFKIVLKTRKLPLGVEEVYFKCTHCNEKYVSYYTDESIRKKQREINKMYEEIAKITDKINKTKAETKSDMEELKKKMLGTQ